MAKNYVRQALRSVTLAKQAIEAGGKIPDDMGRLLRTLNDSVLLYRNSFIVHALSCGVTGRELAVWFKLSPGRISQINKESMIYRKPA